MTTTTQQPTSPPTRSEVRRFELTLTILGAVCGAVVPALLTAGAAPDPAKLVGMALGAALPLLVGAVGPGHVVRVSVAVLLTAVAVVISYGGLRIFATVTDTEPAVPTLQDIIDPEPDPDPDPGPGPGPDPGDALVERAGDLGIKVTPGAIACDAEDGCGPVTVTSVGTAPLRIDDVEFEGDAGSYLAAAGCENTVLEEGENCTISLEFSAERAPESTTTHLVIHQNLPEVPTLVPLEAEGTLTFAPNLALGPATCDRSGLVSDPDGGIVSGQLVIDAPITRSGDVPAVDATVVIDGDLQWTFPVNGDQSSIHVADTYDGPFPTTIVVTIDSAGIVEESSEDDNVANC